MRASWHSRAAVLALLALALQLALPLWHAPAAAAGWLCTAQGLQRVALDADGAPQPVAPQPAKACPICQLAQAGGAGLLPAPTVVAEPVTFVAVLAAVPAGRPVTLAAPPPASRAPPAV